MGEEKQFKVVITRLATIRFQDRVLSYLYKNFSLSRVSIIEEEIIHKANSLSKNPLRGRREKYLSSFSQDFRFILFKETRNLEIKIVYFVDEERRQVYVTDFFPTKMSPLRLLK
jgi:hypothetical protein